MQNLQSNSSVEMSSAINHTSDKQALFGLVKAVNRLQRVIFVLAIGLIGVSVIAALGYYRRPKVMVAVQSADGQRIAQIDDINFGATEQIQMGEDNLNDRDKAELINNWLQLRYAVDLASRSKDVPKFLSLMLTPTAQAYFKQLNETGELQRERDEGWSGTWKTDSLEVDRNDKNLVQVIGTQFLRRIIQGRPKKERIQYKIFFELHTEGKRDDTPLRSGYWLVNFKSEELSRSEES